MESGRGDRRGVRHGGAAQLPAGGGGGEWSQGEGTGEEYSTEELDNYLLVVGAVSGV